MDQTLADAPALEELKVILHRYPGRTPTYLHLRKEPEGVTVLELPPDLQVGLCEEFIFEVEKLLGQSSLVLQ
jgi:hypothetical protein